MTLPYPLLLDRIRAESARFVEVLAGTDPAAPVPACPDWTASDLVRHLGEVQWFWAHVVRTRPAAPGEELAAPPAPDSPAELLAWFRDCSAALVDALAAADPADEAWHWSDVRTVATTYRRQAHEALIHRLDAEQTAGAVTPLDPRLAADGVLEVLEVMHGGAVPAWGRLAPGPHLVGVEVTDEDLAWVVRPGRFTGTDPEDGEVHDQGFLELVPGPLAAPPAAVVSGTAAHLDAWLWHRGGEAGLRVSGDPAAWAAFREVVARPMD